MMIFEESSSSKKLLTETLMQELDYVCLKKIDFQQPKKSKLVAFLHADIIERGIPAKELS